MDIPCESPSTLSDVILITENADGKELHANKGFLSMNSRFFERMFYSNFKEANERSVKVSCDYDSLREILIILHKNARNFSSDQRQYGAEVLKKLYKTADYLDFPAIRQMCVDQMLARPSVETATLALKMGLHETLMGIFMKIWPPTAKKFLEVEDSQLLFSKKDVKAIYNLLASKPLRKPESTFTFWFCARALPDLSENCKTSVIDATQKWTRSDVVFRTKNSQGKKLFSNKTVLSLVSPHFAEMFFSPQATDSKLDHTEIEVDVDYMVMKNILAIVHHSHDKSNLGRFIAGNQYLLYHMFCAAAKDRLDIPIIREICANGLHEFTSDISLEMAFLMNLGESVMQKIIGSLDSDELLEWVYDYNEETSKDLFSISEEDDKFNVKYVSETKPILSLNNVRLLVNRLLDEYNNKFLKTSHNATATN